MGDTTRTYDEVQIQATLVQCAKCGKQWFMTHATAVCALCRRLAGGR